MTKMIDLIGKKIEMLTVIELSKIVDKETAFGDKYTIRYYNCICDCGQTCEVSSRELNSKHPTKSCGCARTRANSSRVQDIAGQKFERLTAKYRDSIDKRKWVCDCDCGNETVVLHAHLKNGNTTSCGCKRAETCSIQLLEMHRNTRVSQGKDPNTPLTPDNLVLRNMFREKLQKKVFDRDNYSCVWCCSTRGPFNVHHIAKWSEHPDLRFEKTNLVTLCYGCHRKVHDYNSYGPVNEVMTILLQGYCNFTESEEKVAVRESITPN